MRQKIKKKKKLTIFLKCRNDQQGTTLYNLHICKRKKCFRLAEPKRKKKLTQSEEMTYSIYFCFGKGRDFVHMGRSRGKKNFFQKVSR